MFTRGGKVATWWQTYATVNNIHFSTMHPFKKAYLQVPNDEALDKKWFVCFWIFDETAKKLVRKRIVISGDSVDIRREKATVIIKEVNEALEKGAVTNPINRDDPKYSKAIDVKPSITILNALQHFLDKKARVLKSRSHETYTSNANTFREFLAHKGIQNIMLRDFTTDYAHAFSDWIVLEKNLSNKSHNKMKGFCSSLFNEFVDREIITKNPFKRIQKLRVTQGKHRVFNQAQIAEFKQLCADNNDDAMWFFVCFIYYTFTRPHQETRMLRIEDIGEKTIKVSEVHAKSSRVRHITIPPPLEAMLVERGIRDYPPHFYVFSYGGPGQTLVGEAYWYERHKRYLKLMGLYMQDYDLYGWKHTGVTALYRATKDLKLVQEQCGHTDIKQTVEYLRDLGVFYYEGQIEKFPPI